MKKHLLILIFMSIVSAFGANAQFTPETYNILNLNKDGSCGNSSLWSNAVTDAQMLIFFVLHPQRERF